MRERGRASQVRRSAITLLSTFLPLGSGIYSRRRSRPATRMRVQSGLARQGSIAWINDYPENSNVVFSEQVVGFRQLFIRMILTDNE